MTPPPDDAALNARLTARLDQVAAYLRDLVAAAREHKADARLCDLNGCAGAEVAVALNDLDCVDVQAVAFVAIARLAGQPAPSTKEAPS